ncbi:MAG: HAMP domain-containing histidine kinase [Nannocystaceae bacterium]|nr:HAMP domain-containing histidine kinase [Nannocystaceae bacterium]
MSNSSRPIKLPLRVVTEEEPPVARGEPGDLNLRVLTPLFRYLREHHGEDTLHRIVRDAGADASALKRSAPWVSLPVFEAILSGVRELVGSDKAFMKACVFDLKKMYGPLLLVIRSMTVNTGYKAMARTSHLVTRVSHYEVVESRRNSILLRYRSKRPDSRLNCLSRQAQLASVPSLWWGLRDARVRVNKRLCDGDEYCEYALSWREPLRLRYPILGALLGFIAGHGLLVTSPATATYMPFLLATLGMGTGLVAQLRLMLQDYLGFAEKTSYEVEKVVQDHAKAVDEILALHNRERQWSHNIETRFHERREKLEEVVGQLDGSSEVASNSQLLNLSHDMNNPLTVLRASAQQLSRFDGHRDADYDETVGAVGTAVDRLEALLTEMSSIVRGDGERPPVATDISVDDLTNRIRRQLRATVMGRDIRITVFQTRESPPTLHTDETLLERVVDNILTNACKYTKEGSIVAEVSGVPGHLQIKVSDTGRGIGEDRLEQVFFSGQPDRTPIAGTSRGDGLSIVVRMLDQLGGRLEIMSSPGEGTTIWVTLPVNPTPGYEMDTRSGHDTPRSRFERVVRIRPRA